MFWLQHCVVFSCKIHQDYKSENYEGILKEIEDMKFVKNRDRAYARTITFGFGSLVEIIYDIIWAYHKDNLDIYLESRRYYDLLSEYVSNEELWVLSLNHDLILESLCLDFNIPLTFGSTEKNVFPQNNMNMKKSMNFQQVHRRNISLKHMDFFENTRGINLIKLHGALNEYSYDNSEKIVHIEPTNDDTSASYLKKTENVLKKAHFFLDDKPVQIQNEIPISDFDGNMQFFRKSLLTGGYKYSETFNKKPGEEKIHLAEEVLREVDELTIIGYGFGDNHINQRLYNAMLLNEDMSITIVDPFMKNIPEILRPFNYNRRVRKVTSRFPEWLVYLKYGKWDSTYFKQLNEIRRNVSAMNTDIVGKYL
ncbi:hypothetical protein B0H94_11276 [Salsuginibacillus halophilus]|uniref:SIR2-like protein n=1 Tax=Salsuginibacillus halophilus TaxID=517424 RepID=A0A2P8H9T5_9BACI|nr:hypothetical protein [Salsuginibacillus halophilus]PSL42993.1 hypothetical protein B0H94_11276 [Salsuginibacillus halophilus]